MIAVSWEGDETMTSSAGLMMRRRRFLMALIPLILLLLGVTALAKRARDFHRSQKARHHIVSSGRTHGVSRSERDARFPSVKARGDDQCETCHATRDEWLVVLYRESTHGRRRLACTICHAGDSSTSDQRSAHMNGFVGRPTADQTLMMCRPCHAQIVEVFTTSRHYIERQAAARLDCVHCHGAHAIGGSRATLSFAYICAGCHGLEYLPALPSEFQTLLEKRDELTPLLPILSGPRGDELLARRGEIRAGIAALVHETDSVNGMKEIPRLVERIEELKRLLEKERKE